jgi:hypothetical protein
MPISSLTHCWNHIPQDQDPAVEMVLVDISHGYFQDWGFYCRDAAGIGDQGLQNYLGNGPQNP